MTNKKVNQSKILITGSGGMLGSAFAEVLRIDYPESTIIPLDHKALDVTNKEAVMSLASTNVDIIIHCAAKSNVDYCERNPEDCRNTQVEGTSNIISLASECGAKIMYPQTFLIFSGGEELITSETEPNPLSEYGRCKLDAERRLCESDVDSLIIRKAGLYGGDSKDKNFVGFFTRKVSELLNEGISEYAVGNRVWQPTYTMDVARNTLILLDQGNSGIWSMACEGKASFYELAKACISILGLSERFHVIPAESQQIEAADVAKRPPAAILSNDKLRAAGLCTQRHWETALSEYLLRPWFQSLFSH